MNEPKHKYVTLFSSFVISIDSAVTDDAEKGRLYTAIAHYSLYGTEPELTGISAALFELMRPNIDTSNKRRLAGEKGGKKSKTQANCKQNESKTQANCKQCPPMEKEKEKEIGDGIGNGESINTFSNTAEDDFYSNKECIPNIRYTEQEKSKVMETCTFVRATYPRCNYPIRADFSVCAAVKRIAKERGVDIIEACHYLQDRVKLYAECKYGAERQYLPEANNWLDNGGYDANEKDWTKGAENGTNAKRYIPKNF